MNRKMLAAPATVRILVSLERERSPPRSLRRRSFPLARAAMSSTLQFRVRRRIGLSAASTAGCTRAAGSMTPERPIPYDLRTETYPFTEVVTPPRL
jgi:hypothetical protein